MTCYRCSLAPHKVIWLLIFPRNSEQLFKALGFECLNSPRGLCCDGPAFTAILPLWLKFLFEGGSTKWNQMKREVLEEAFSWVRTSIHALISISGGFKHFWSNLGCFLDMIHKSCRLKNHKYYCNERFAAAWSRVNLLLVVAKAAKMAELNKTEEAYTSSAATGD